MKNFRWNFSVNVIDLAFYTLGMSIVSQATIMPLLISTLTTSTIVIGLVPAIFNMGFLLPQLLTASYTERLRRKLPFISTASGVGERGPYLVIGLFVLFFAEKYPTLTLIVILLMLATSAITAGVLTPAWYDLIAKVIPVERRGVFAGTGFGLGAFMGIAGAALSGQILERWPYATNFAICFFAATIFFAISWAGLVANREPESDVVKAPILFKDYMRQIPVVIKKNRNYQAYLIARSIANLGYMASGFFIVYGAKEFHLNGSQVGLMTGILVATQTVMNLLLGAIADKRGHKIVLVCGTIGMGLASLAMLGAQQITSLYVVFFCLGIAVSADTVSSLNIILEFCAPEDRPTYIGLTNTLLAPSRGLAPLIGGWIASWSGYDALFLAALLASLAGAFLLGLWLREPRKHPSLINTVKVATDE
jgi:MFS family permease